MEIKIKDLGNSELELEGEINAETFSTYRPKAIKSISEETQIDGFRPGHIPEKILIEKVGEIKILYEMAELALTEAYPKILSENKIDAIGQPEITLTKIAKDNPLGFKIKTAVLPKINLTDYKSVAKKINDEKEEEIIVEEKEVDDLIDSLRRERSKHEHNHKEGEKCDGKITMPELDDDFAKSLGEFESVADLKSKIRENIKLDKIRRAKEKKRLKIVEVIKDKSEINIPAILIEAEKDKMLSEMELQIRQMGLNFEDYLTHLKKTREELRSGWDNDAKNRVAFGLVVNEIARIEQIKAPEEELKKEVDFLSQRYKDIDQRRIEAYAENLIVNEKVLEFLENWK